MIKLNNRSFKLLLLSFFATAFLVSCSSNSTKYEYELQADYSVKVTSPDGAVQTFQPDFLVLSTSTNPNKALRRGDFNFVCPEGTNQGLLYNVPTWGRPDHFVVDPKMHIEDGFNPVNDRTYGPDRTANYFAAAPTFKLHATGATEQEDHSIVWNFEDNEQFSFTATLSESDFAGGLPKLTVALTPKVEGWFSAGYVGAPESKVSDIDEIWQGHLWQEKRFPNQPFMSEAFRVSIPAALVSAKGVTTAVVADPRYVPYESYLPTSESSQFGVMLHNYKGNAQSMVFAPVLGNEDSHMKPQTTFSFDMYLFQEEAPLLDAYEHIAYNVCQLKDIRRNSTCNLNTTIENVISYIDGPWGMFIDSLRGFNYATDVPGAVKNISGMHPFESAILTNDEHLFTRMARPMLEYGLSRQRLLFLPRGTTRKQYSSSQLGGPGVTMSDLTTAYSLSGDRLEYFLAEARKMYDEKQVRSINLDAILYEDRWINSLALYRATGEQKYLDQAMKDCDTYLENRVKTKQTDFTDKFSQGWFFWTSFTNQWMELLQMYQLSGEKRYLDAAHEGARYFAQFCWVLPVIPDGTVRVNIGGEVPHYRDDASKFKYMKLPEQDVEAWKLSEIGLTPESSGTASGHRAIFMAHHAPFMMRIAAETGDKFLHDIARHAVVGRYEGFPAYHINRGRTNAFERKDFCLRPLNEVNGHNSLHYNHPASFLAMLWDYLFSDFYYVSDRGIDFPSEYAEGYAYCRSLIYGFKPGHFYDEQNVRAYMPKGLVQVSDIQMNYLSGFGNHKLYVALANQSNDDRHVVLTLDAATAFMDASKEYKATLWQENERAGEVVVKNCQVELDVKAKGITAIAIEGVDVKTPFLDKLVSGTKTWTKNYTSVGFENDRAVYMDFGDDLKSVYVWHEADDNRFKNTTLHYAIDGKWSTMYKEAFPFEFTVEIPQSATSFEYWFECKNTANKVEKSQVGSLTK